MSNVKVQPSIITREFNAPMQLVFDAWTQPEHLKNWMFPMEGFTCEYASADIRTGGSSLHKMKAPNGFEMWLLTKYEEVTPQNRLAFLQYMSNEAGEIVPNPQMPNWPKHMLATIELSEKDGKTLLTLTWEPVEPSEAEVATFTAALESAGNGWSSGVEQLAKYLEQLG